MTSKLYDSPINNEKVNSQSMKNSSLTSNQAQFGAEGQI